MQLDLSQLIIAVVGTGVWLIRLEGKEKANRREIDLIWEYVKVVHGEHKELAGKVVIELSAMKESLARIEGKLSK